MKFFKFHINDFMAGASHLDRDSEYALFKLLVLYYRNERPFTESVERLAALCKMSDKVETIKAVLNEFFYLADDGWRNSRCDAELVAWYEKSESARQAALKRHQATKDVAEKKPLSDIREFKKEAESTHFFSQDADAVLPNTQDNTNKEKNKPLCNENGFLTNAGVLAELANNGIQVGNRGYIERSLVLSRAVEIGVTADMVANAWDLVLSVKGSAQNGLYFYRALLTVVQQSQQLDASASELPQIEPKTQSKAKVSVNHKAAQVALLMDMGVTEKAALGFVDNRTKKKKSILTEYELTNWQEEAKSKGWTLPDAIAYCAEKGWADFKAAWVDDKKQAENPIDAIARENADFDKRTKATAGIQTKTGIATGIAALRKTLCMI